MTTDIQIRDCGTIVQVRPTSDAGRAWFEENMQEASDWATMGPWTCCGRRPGRILLQAAAADGLDVAA